MHTCTLQSLFFSLQVYRAGFLLIMPALLTSRSAYQCIPSHTWTAHHTAQFGTTRGTWEKSLNWKRKKNVVLFREKLNIARCYNSTLHYCTYLQRYSFLYLPFTLFSQSSTFSFHGVVQHAAHAKSHAVHAKSHVL